MTPPAILLEGLTCVHDRLPAVQHLSGRFLPGSLTAVVGPNGAGKTTLLRALAGLHPAHSGRIDRGGLVPGRIALLAQAGTLDRSFPVSCREVVALGAWAEMGPFRRLPDAAAARTEAALHEVGLAGFGPRLVGTLSAGQFQRVLFARLAVQDAPVLLLDEPFNAVDSRTAGELMALLRRWHGQGRTIVAVLHDLDLVLRRFPETLLLARGPIAWGPTARVLSAENRRRARLAADAWAEDAPPCRDAA
jgi:zinc/manganese transport system ATP-binding protein